MAEEEIYQQLHKLSVLKSEVDILEDALLTLWKTRKTGLSSSDKTHFQSLLHLQSISQLDPVLACLRSLMRKFVHENLKSDDLYKLFPSDLPIELKRILVLLLQKHQHKWKEDISTDLLHRSLRTSVGASSEMPQPLLWPSQNDPNACFGGSAPIFADSNASLLDPDINNQGMLPCLKSMTWSIENKKSASANKVAIISLKLQDSTSRETEVKFRLTRESLEAMLRSMAYISKQLSNTVESSSSDPVQKRQRHSEQII